MHLSVAQEHACRIRELVKAEKKESIFADAALISIKPDLYHYTVLS